MTDAYKLNEKPWASRIVGHDVVQPDQLLANPLNARIHGKLQQDATAGNLDALGWVKSVVVNRQTGHVVDGHLRVTLALRNGSPVPVEYVDLTEAEEAQALATLDPLTELATYDAELLTALLAQVNTDDAALQEMLAQMAEAAGIVAKGAPVDAEPQINRADELREIWQTELGQMWLLDSGKGHPHRLICGDCTVPAVVARVMGGERAALCHADPPYGMGKENEGIANDNLYREKLDAFQMQWWKVARPHLEDNASAYIWGNAEDLWRLWYCGGLRDSERLTLRNEVVWDKGHGQGMESDAHRMYPTATERCLFFMLGEQGFNNNADNYWEGWEGIVDYLESQRQAAGWSIKDTKRIAGHSEKSGCHWFDKSQWSMPTEDTYKAWQAAARGDAFKREYDDIKREYDDIKREYDDIKREFYATRAYFDNTHDSMTDVWQYGRVMGDDRQGHATPKPVEMMARIIQSSAPVESIAYVPFGGTCPEIIACENLSRQCRAVEISAAYTAVCLQRFLDATTCTPVLLDA